MAGAAIVATAEFYLVITLIMGAIGGLFEGTTIRQLTISSVMGYVPLAVITMVVFVPSAFVAGVVVWRIVPDSMRFAGPLGGMLATGVSYLLGALLVGFAVAVYDTTVGLPSKYLDSLIVGPIVTSVLLLVSVFLYTFWATVPVGLLAGALYERSQGRAS